LGRVEATFLDEASGRPVSGVRVRVSMKSRAYSESTTSVEGRARSIDLPPGHGSLYVESDLHLPFTRELEIEPGRSTDLGVIQLSRGIEIAGRVELEDRELRRVNLRCSLEGRPGFESWTVKVKDVLTERDGTFVFTALRPGRYLIGPVPARDHNEFEEAQTFVDAQQGSVRGLVVRIVRSKSIR
jgi:hypothetical protein